MSYYIHLVVLFPLLYMEDFVFILQNQAGAESVRKPEVPTLNGQDCDWINTLARA